MMRGAIEQQLDFSCDLIRDGHGRVPSFAINTPDGDYVIMCPLPEEHQGRIERLQLVSRFMAYKMATSFVFSVELLDPDAVSSVGVARDHVLAGIRIFERKPLKFSQTQWIEGIDQIGDEIPSLLPNEFEELSAGQINEIETAIKAFSPKGIERLRDEEI